MGTFDDFLIIDKEEPPKKTTIFNLDDWIILGKPDEKQNE